ncbi:MAG: TRAP transporter small permease subunit [Bacteroidota bacterium]
MKKVVAILDSISEHTGRIFSWSTSLMVWIVVGLVVMRYGFGAFSQKASELTTYFFAISFLMASGYAFKNDNHVRVDLFYAKWSDRGKALVNLIGGLFFLLPWCIVSCIVCFEYAKTSFLRGEVSDQPSGLPALYLLKFILLLGFVLLLIQGVSSIFKAITVLRGQDTYKEESTDELKTEGTWEH